MKNLRVKKLKSKPQKLKALAYQRSNNTNISEPVWIETKKKYK